MRPGLVRPGGIPPPNIGDRRVPGAIAWWHCLVKLVALPREASARLRDEWFPFLLFRQYMDLARLASVAPDLGGWPMRIYPGATEESLFPARGERFLSVIGIGTHTRHSGRGMGPREALPGAPARRDRAFVHIGLSTVHGIAAVARLHVQPGACDGRDRNLGRSKGPHGDHERFGERWAVAARAAHPAPHRTGRVRSGPCRRNTRRLGPGAVPEGSGDHARDCTYHWHRPDRGSYPFHHRSRIQDEARRPRPRWRRSTLVGSLVSDEQSSPVRTPSDRRSSAREARPRRGAPLDRLPPFIDEPTDTSPQRSEGATGGSTNHRGADRKPAQCQQLARRPHRSTVTDAGTYVRRTSHVG